MLPEPTEDIARVLSDLEKKIERLGRLDQVFTINVGDVVINEAGLDTDLRIEGDSEVNLLFVDAGDDRVGIATGSPQAKMHSNVGAGSTAEMAGLVYGATQSGNTFTDIGTLVRDTATLVVGNNFGTEAGNVLNCYGAAADNLLFVVADGGIFMSSLLSAAASTDVNINGSNELHRVASSKRFKKFIQPLAQRFDSSFIYDLEPASFVWKKNTGNPNMVDFGLVAEDVYEVFPELVNLDQDESPYSIRHNLLSVLLLAELQKLERRVGILEAN